MAITLQQVKSILLNHDSDMSKIKSLEILIEHVTISNVDDLNEIVTPFNDKTKVFKLLYDNNKLSDVQTEHLQFYGFVKDTNILNKKAEMDTLKLIISVSPDMIVDVLNFIKGTNKTDDNKIELIQTVLNSSDIFSKLIEKIGPNELANLMSVYFVNYDSYLKCCKLLDIEEDICSKYKETIESDNDTITFFGEHKLRFSQMAIGKFYSFEKYLDDSVIVYNIKKLTFPVSRFDPTFGKPHDANQLIVEKYITNINRTIVNSHTDKVISFNHKGCIANEHSFFVDAK